MYSFIIQLTMTSSAVTHVACANPASLLLPVLQLNGIDEQAYSEERPLVLLNDKRFGADAQPDRRSIVDVDGVAANLSAAYPFAEV